MDGLPPIQNSFPQPPPAPKKPGKAPARDFSSKGRRLFTPDDDMRDLSNRLGVTSIKKDPSIPLSDGFLAKVKEKLGAEGFKELMQRMSSMDPREVETALKKALDK